MIYWHTPPQAKITPKVGDLNSHHSIKGAASMNNPIANPKVFIGATAKLDVLLILNLYFIKGNLMLLISFCSFIF